MTYEEFIASKLHVDSDDGFEPVFMPDEAFDFQAALIAWAVRKGRGALFEECGLGKTLQQLAWAENVRRHTNRPVLILTPLAVGAQTVREGAKFGLEVRRTQDGTVHNGLNVTNYERLGNYNPGDFGGVVCDESGILKSFDGTIKSQVVEFMRKVAFRLLCSATPAPNDFYEFGNSSEALGYLGFMDMLNRFFKNNRNNSALKGNFKGTGMPQWTFRGHAEKPFWRWVCSWARSIRRPSDLGFDDGAFALPPLVENEHIVRARKARDGYLFAMPAVGLSEEREDRRRTLTERCERAADLVNDTGKPAVVWCHLNDEGELLEQLIPDAEQVSGADSDEEKERKFEAFAQGQIRVMITKQIIGAWGLNWQHCSHSVHFASHSFEQYYQSVRRFWRFGQKNPVVVDHVVSDGEHRVLSNLRRKAEQAEKIFTEITANMRDELRIKPVRQFTTKQEVPSWL